MSTEDQRVIGQEVMAECRAKFLRSLDDNHALDKAAKVLLETIKATENKCFNANGEIIYSRNMAAHNARLKAIELLVQLYGLKAPERMEHSGAVIIERRIVGAEKEDGKGEA